MNDFKPELKIIGVGMGGAELLTERARMEIETAVRVLSTHRIATDFAELNTGIYSADMDEIRAILEEETDCAVLISGDAGFFSFSKRLISEFSTRYDIEIINGLNSLQYLCGRLGVPYDDVKCISVHGRNGRLIPAAAYNRRVFVLTGGENSVSQALLRLKSAGLGELMAHVGEDLSYPDEKIISGTVAELCEGAFSGLAVLLLENGSAVSPFSRLRDGDFARGDVPMTKETVRVISCSRLDVKPGDTVWDIGAGTGSVSVALARIAFEGMVFAVEKEPEALALIAQNREKLGAYNIKIVEARAPEGLLELPAPDRVFIGGSAGSLKEVLEIVLQKSDSCAVCVNAITLETLHEAVSCFEEMGFSDVEIECVNVARAREAGRYHLMAAQNPVYIISAALGVTGEAT